MSAPPPRPAPGPPRPYAFPPVVRATLANGVRVRVAPNHRLPLVTALFVVDAGALVDPTAREGLAELTADCLGEGTTTHDGAVLAERFESLGTSFSVHADWDSAVGGVTVLPRHLPEALALAGTVLRSPSIPDHEVERLRAERLAELLQLRAEPRGLADEGFARLLYRTESRYALPAGGTSATVRALGRADVVAFHAARYRPAATTVILAGDITPDVALALVDRTVGDWRGEAPATAAVDDRPARGTRAVHVVRKPDAPQTELRLGHVGVPRGHAEYFPLVVMNAILGGLFSSRLNLNLRERHGYTYGAHSGFAWRRGAGPFVMSAAVQREATAPAVTEMLRELDGIREAPVRPEELSLAVDYLDGVFPIRFETTGAVASALATLAVHGLPDDYFDTYRPAVRAVTAADVLRVARAHLDPAQLQLLAVGDASAIRAPLDALGFAPVEEHDPADLEVAA